MEGLYTVHCCHKLLIYRVQGHFVKSSNEILRRVRRGRRVYKQLQLHLNVIIVAIPEALNISTVRCMSL